MHPESAETFGESFRLTFLTDDPRSALLADEAGIDRIGIDLEHLGKAERQARVESRLSRHTISDLSRIASCVRRADLFARLNPIHPQTSGEIEASLHLGVRTLMLPYFHTAAEVDQFVRIVDGRAYVMILIESTAALTRIREILAVAGIDEVMIGLNDLHIQLRVANHFEVLASPLLEMVGAEIRRRGLQWSVGGVGRAGDETLPVPASLVHAQYPRLGATGAWISRSFTKTLPPQSNLADEIRNLRNSLTHWATQSPEALQRARDELSHRAAQWSPASHTVV